jgi:hypothetical protein
MNVVDALTANEPYKPRAFASQQWGTWTNMYEWSPSQAKSLFTPETVQQICNFEQTMFSHKKFSEFCIIDYDNNFGNGNDACVPPSLTPTRLFYETQILDCDDYMSRLFLAINTSNVTDPSTWNNKDLVSFLIPDFGRLLLFLYLTILIIDFYIIFFWLFSRKLQGGKGV